MSQSNEAREGRAEEQKHPTSRRPLLEGDLREFVVIVLSILTAFAIDAWWGARQESRNLEAALRAVQSELTQTVDSLQATQVRFESKANAGTRLLQLTGPSASEEAVLEATDLIGTVMRGSSAEVSTASLAMLVSAGQLSQIESAELRQALSLWPESLEHLYEMQAAVLQTWLQEVRPLIIQAVPYIDLDLQVGFRDYPELRDEFARAVGQSRFDSDFVSLLRELRFENGIHTVTTLSMIGARRAESRVREAEWILQQLRVELR